MSRNLSEISSSSLDYSKNDTEGPSGDLFELDSSSNKEGQQNIDSLHECFSEQRCTENNETNTGGKITTCSRIIYKSNFNLN